MLTTVSKTIARWKDWFRTGSRFRRNFAAMAWANLLALLLPILVTPILTRLYNASDFGTLAIFASALGILTAAATFRIDWLASIVRDDDEAGRVFLLGVCQIAVTSLLLLGIWLSGWHRQVLPVEWALPEPLVWMFPLALLGAGLYQMLSIWFVRSGDLAPVGTAKVAQSVATGGVGLAGGIYGLGAGGLIGAASASPWVGVAILARRTRKDLMRVVATLSPLALCRTLKSTAARILIGGATGLVNSIGLLLPPILIAAYYSPEESGWYAMMHRLAMGPVMSITQATSQSFWVEARRSARSGALQPLFLGTSRRLAWLALPVACACLAGPLYVGPVLGAHEWSEAGYVLMALAPFICSSMVVSPLAPTIVVLGGEKWLFVWDSLRTGLVIVGFYVADLNGLRFMTTMIAFGLLMTLMYVLLFVLNVVMISRAAATETSSLPDQTAPGYR